jgi:hypothetical protein
MAGNAEKLVDSRIPVQYCTERGRFRNSEQTASDVLLRNIPGFRTHCVFVTEQTVDYGV